MATIHGLYSLYCVGIAVLGLSATAPLTAQAQGRGQGSQRYDVANEMKVALAKGDTLVVVGSRVTVDGEQVFIAKEVKKGDSVWTLRDAAGLPLWRGRGGRQ